MKKDSYPLYRASNLHQLNQAIQDDEFDDLAKHALMGYVYVPDFLAFIERNLQDYGPVLDVGCGSGASFDLLPITHALEANPARWRLAASTVRALAKDVTVKLGAAECLPFDAGTMGNVLHLQGFFQVRSDWEALIEYNRVLVMGGRFIFDLPSVARPVVFGRTFEARSYVKICADYGFDLVEMRDLSDGFIGICLEKTREWDPRRMRKVQLVPSPHHTGLYEAKNLDPNDWTLR